MIEPAPDAARWLGEARAGSREALGQALEACRAYLLLVAVRELDPDLRAKGGASDLVQQTFLEAQRDFDQFRGATEAELLGWLRQVLLHNLAHFRRRYRDAEKRQVSREVPLAANSAASVPGLEVSAKGSSPSRQLMAQEKAAALERALARLPDDYRLVIALRYDENRSFEDIGRIMQRTANAARKLWARAVERLEAELGESS